MIINERQIVTQARVVTQTITRVSTTITALVTLGPGDSTITTPPAPTAPEIVPAPAPAPAATSSSPALTNEQLGAILGSVLGFLVVVLPILYCCCCRQPVQWRTNRPDYSSSDDESERVVRHVRVMRPRPEPFHPVLVPGPPRIPPQRYAPYRQTAEPQIGGVRIYP